MKKIIDNLNPAQERAVCYDENNPLMVLAGAGSGKTRVLTHRAAWLISQEKARLDNLLLLTFTNKAAGEMKQRLQTILQKIDLPKENLRQNGSFLAGTFHSFGAYILRRDGKGIGISPDFVIYDMSDQKSLLSRVLKALGYSKKNFKLNSLKFTIGAAKNDLIDADTFVNSANGLWRERVGIVYQEYQKALEKANALDFSDLLFYTVKLFQSSEKVRKKYQDRYRYVLIDEYQDTNKSQYVLTKLLVGEKNNLTVVGDASQAIYGWRGADYRNLNNLKKDFNDIKIINLEQNYRSTQNILDAAYGVISQNQKHPILKLFTQKNNGPKVVVNQTISEIGEAEFVAQKIKQLTDFDGVDPTQIAVLYRTNAQSRVLEEVFIESGIPYILFGGTKFYDRREIKDVLALIRVFYNSKDTVSWARIEKNMGKRRQRRVEEFCEANQAKKLNTETLLKEIVLASRYLGKFNSEDAEDQSRLENIKELNTVAKKFPEIGGFLENVSLVQEEYFSQEKQKHEVQQTAVNLMTLHSSKGLEFKVVFIVGMEEGLLPHSRSQQDIDGLEEERRLCYVGMTRAQERLFLTNAAKRFYFGRTTYNQPSRFIDDIPNNAKLQSADVHDIIESDWDEFDDDWLEDW